MQNETPGVPPVVGTEPMTAPMASGGETSPATAGEQVMADAVSAAERVVAAAEVATGQTAAEVAAGISAAAEAVGLPPTEPSAETAIVDRSSSQTQSGRDAMRVVTGEQPSDTTVENTTEPEPATPAVSAWPAPEPNATPLENAPAAPVAEAKDGAASAVGNPVLDAVLTEAYGDPSTKSVEAASDAATVVKASVLTMPVINPSPSVTETVPPEPTAAETIVPEPPHAEIVTPAPELAPTTTMSPTTETVMPTTTTTTSSTTLPPTSAPPTTPSN